MTRKKKPRIEALDAAEAREIADMANDERVPNFVKNRMVVLDNNVRQMASCGEYSMRFPIGADRKDERDAFLAAVVELGYSFEPSAPEPGDRITISW